VFPKNRIYSRWWGPVVGAMVGIEYGLDHANTKQPGEFLPVLLCSVGLGVVAGTLILFLDPPLQKQVDIIVERSKNASSPSLAGNILCALSLIFFFMPYFNVTLAGLALACNWKVGGWPKFLSLLALQIGIVVTYLIVRVWMHY